MKNISGIFSRIALFAAVAGSLAVSCDKYDDSELREQIEIIVTKLYELEQKMNNEIDALKGMLSGKILITDVAKDVNTGITTVTLSNGSKLQLLPEKDLKSFVTYITSGGVNYWAYIDKDGKKQYFLNKDGEAIPVVSEMPKVITKDKDTFLLIGGVEYPLSGNSVFSDYEVIKDELTGEVVAVTFTFGDSMSFTVTVDNAASFLFVQNNGITSTILKEYYVAPGEKTNIQIQATGVADYVLQIPDGWRVKDGEDALLGKYFEVTAPETALVESGVAAAEGELKVVAVLEGGKATVAKLNLTTEPFKELVVSAGNATVKMTVGLVKYVYGVCDMDNFDEEAIYAAAETLLGSVADAPAGYGMTTFDLEAVSLAEIAGSELLDGHEYVFWAIPAAYSDADAKFYLKDGTMQKVVSRYGSVRFEVGDVTFNDAHLKLDAKGVTSYYLNVVPKADYDAAHVLNVLNVAPESYTLRTEPMTYDGSLFELAGVEAVKATEYVAWLVIVNEERDYVEADIIRRDFTTLDLVPGSTVTVTAVAQDPTYSDVAVALTATGADDIYYIYSEASTLPSFASEEEKAKYVMANGKVVAGETAETKASDCLEKIKPETSLKLLALASDATGKYSAVLEQEYKTAVMPQSDLKVNLAVAMNTPEEVRLSISTEGGEPDGYLYWLGKASSNVWTSKNMLGGSAETAQEYMQKNPTSSRFTNAATNYPIVDGIITMKDHAVREKYILVAMAKNAAGTYSNATVLEFTPYPVNIGNVVQKTADEWKAAEAALQVNFIQESFNNDGEFATYSYNVTLPSNYTAYIISGSDAWLTHEDGSMFTPEEKICEIMIEADDRRDADGIVDGVDKHWRYEHGSHKFGYVVVWANETVHDALCKLEDCEGNRDEVRDWMGETGVNVSHVVLYNDGTPVTVTYPNAAGNSEKVVDRVFIVLQDLDGNCYVPYEIDVPYQYFGEGGGGFGVDSES